MNNKNTSISWGNFKDLEANSQEPETKANHVLYYTAPHTHPIPPSTYNCRL